MSRLFIGVGSFQCCVGRFTAYIKAKLLANFANRYSFDSVVVREPIRNLHCGLRFLADCGTCVLRSVFVTIIGASLMAAGCSDGVKNQTPASSPQTKVNETTKTAAAEAVERTASAQDVASELANGNSARAAKLARAVPSKAKPSGSVTRAGDVSITESGGRTGIRAGDIVIED